MPSQIDNHLLSLMISDHAQDLDWESFSPTDWDLIVRRAQAEGVASHLYWKLSQSKEIKSIPESLWNSLRAMYFSVRMNNEAIIKELEMLTYLFDQAGIPVVALKGICFLLTIYPDVGLRPMADLDLLVPASKLTKAMQIAISLGYVDTALVGFSGLRDWLGQEISLQKTSAPYSMLELHNSLLVDKSFTYAVPVEWFWGQTEPLETSQWRFGNLYMLTPIAQVLYAAAHAMLKHGGRDTTLRWYYDLDRLIRFYAARMDWDLLLRQARAFEWGSALHAAFFQTYTYFNTPIPDRVLADLIENPDRHQRLVALKQVKPATHVLEEYQNLMTINWYGRIILILRLILPGPAYMRWRYQLKTYWTLPVYYLFRWWGIFIDMTRTAIVLIQKGLHRSHVDTPDYKNR